MYDEAYLVLYFSFDKKYLVLYKFYYKPVYLQKRKEGKDSIHKQIK